MSQLTQDTLKSLLTYNPETGVFTWLVDRGRGVRAGNIAGGDDGRGYTRIRINTIRYKAHRLAWLYVYGRFPVKHIDHINRNTSDNRIVNLREVDDAQNAQNKKTYCNSKSGVRGVRWHTQFLKWHVRIMVNGKQNSLGLYDSLEEAIIVRKNAEIKLHPYRGDNASSNLQC